MGRSGPVVVAVLSGSTADAAPLSGSTADAALLSGSTADAALLSGSTADAVDTGAPPGSTVDTGAAAGGDGPILSPPLFGSEPGEEASPPWRARRAPACVGLDRRLVRTSGCTRRRRRETVAAAQTVTTALLAIAAGFSDAGTQLFGHSGYRHFLSDTILHSEYRFDTFVKGQSNSFALAAAEAVANARRCRGGLQPALPPRRCRPRQDAPPAGHLPARRLELRPDTRIVYLSCESFVNQFVSAVRDGAVRDFRFRFRNVDMLLIDDIHFLAQKERTQEEFFHTFNTLYNLRRQIILTCDRPPGDIPSLEERLVSRFKWGLDADIGAPDHETRAEIVRAKAASRNVVLPQEVIDFIVDHITANVRELEGAVQRVSTQAHLFGKPLTLEFARTALREMVHVPDRTVSIETIIRVVSEQYGQRPSELMGKSRVKSVSRPRQVAMYLARRLTEKSLVEIGAHFGGRDHSTVIYACDRIAGELGENERMAEDLEVIKRRIRAGG